MAPSATRCARCPASGEETLQAVDRANLFIVPLDSERRWYRYHHLFGELLRQGRQQSAVLSGGEDDDHLRASEWLEAKARRSRPSSMQPPAATSSGRNG